MIKPFLWNNKLADYIVEYTCTEDCKMSGCEGHRARLQLNSVSDIFNVTFKLCESNQETLSFNLIEFGIIKDFMDKLTGERIG